MTGDDGREIGRRRRRERLAAALRENLKRRKAQRRGRGPTEESIPPGGPARGASEEPSR
jgi:hypothetical protein